MKFSDIIGNEDIKKALVGMADSGRVPHAMMMYENEGGGALALALAFIQYLNCPNRHDGDSCGECPSCNQNRKLIYPDVHFTFPITTGTKVSGEAKSLVCDMFVNHWRELVIQNPYFLENEMNAALGFEKKQGLITVAEGRSILQKLSLSPMTDGYRPVIVWLPEKMNRQTANMLLKAIEEPVGKTIFIMITHAPEEVLQTISSRCQAMRILPISKEEVTQAVCEMTGKSREEVEPMAAISGGSIGVALHNLSEQSGLSDMRDLFMDLMMALMRKDLAASLEAGEAIAALDSREKQKMFCSFAGEGLRKIFMVQQKLDSIAAVSPDEVDFIRKAAAGCKKTFCRKAMAVLDKAEAMIERNVNQKIVFTTLVCRLFAIM